MNTKIIVMFAAVALLGLAHGASAHGGDHVGLSGACYNTDSSQGGGDEARVHGDGHVVLLPGTTGDSDLTDGEGGAADALLHFGVESAKEGGNTGQACDRYDCRSASECGTKPMRRDYLEVSAKYGSFAAQVCYDASVTISGGCPTSPSA